MRGRTGLVHRDNDVSLRHDPLQEVEIVGAAADIVGGVQRIPDNQTHLVREFKHGLLRNGEIHAHMHVVAWDKGYNVLLGVVDLDSVPFE